MFKGVKSYRHLSAIGILLVGVSMLSGCSFSNITFSQVPNAVSDGSMTLLWGPEIKQQALAMIDTSTKFVHLTMYELGDRTILRALRQAQQRGVKVKVVVDATEPHTASVAIPYFQRYHIAYRLLKIAGGISHIKSLVTEQGTQLRAMLGGMNFGEYSWQNHDASVYFSHASTGFEGLFQEDYARAGGMEDPVLRFSMPLLYDDQIEPAMLFAIAHARSSIDIEAFAFTSHTLIQALENAVSRGVHVTVILDPHESYNRYTAKRLRQNGISVRYYAPYDGEYLHAKVICIDGGRYIFVGSANFSYHGFHVNHEGDVELVSNPAFGSVIDQDVQNQWNRGQSVANSSYGE